MSKHEYCSSCGGHLTRHKAWCKSVDMVPELEIVKEHKAVLVEALRIADYLLTSRPVADFSPDIFHEKWWEEWDKYKKIKDALAKVED